MDRPTKPRISKSGLQILLQALKLAPEHSEASNPDVVLVSIDFENTGNLMNNFLEAEDSQTGLAVLDTKDLHRVNTTKIISTYNLITGSPSYILKSSKKFLFGNSSTIRPPEILKSITSIIPENRVIVLIGHSVRCEVDVLAKLGFDFRENSISGIIDTSRLANKVLGICGNSLRELLTVLGCPFNKLHSAGNDAHFALRAALLLATRGCKDPSHATSTILRTISFRDIPYRVDPEVRAALKKKKRLAKSRKHQSKSWSVERQNEIRAERAANKQRAAQDDHPLI
ncbi:Polynucleotidyl transferase [Cordyceps militaris CM01]|uniref:Polynucleotidyl transferase n=1 Tax=Cordyceps militaris (strain CM01) TaxID=983644 RepID=G3JTY8_CORMM|nr:Polynucleotidyl transferase [Cordyceps militaris CM01]EGX88142.1 Polynucleotidyl transferase [Cordyceps militaris CM01]